MRTEFWKHVAVASVLLIVLMALRVMISTDDGLQRIDGFETSTGQNVGPDVAFFGSGLNGDAATFVIVALDPFGSDLGHILNEPSYRYARFGYSWAAAGLVAARDELILLGFSIVGFASVGAIGFAASRLNRVLGRRSWLLVVNPALLLGIMGDTSESLALLAMTMALAASAPWLQGVAGMVTAVVRPSYLVAIFARWRVFGIALALAISSKVFWSLRFDDPITSGGQALDWPLLGIINAPSLLAWIVVLAGLMTAVIGLRKRDWGWVAGGIFVLIFSAIVYDTPTNAVRAAGYLPVLWAFGPNWQPARVTQASHVVDDH